MLKRFEIRHFRLCNDLGVDFAGPVTALVGRNGVGKSNLLQSINLAARIATAQDAEAQSKFWGELASAALEFDIAGEGYRYEMSPLNLDNADKTNPSYQESLRRRNGTGWKLVLSRTGGTVTIADQTAQIGTSAPFLPTLASLLPAENEIQLVIKPIISFLSAIRYYALEETESALLGIIMADAYNRWQSNGDPGAYEDDILFRILQMHIHRRDDFDALNHMLGQNGLGIVDEIQVQFYDQLGLHATISPGIDPLFYFVRFLPSRGNGQAPISLDFKNLSSGTRRVIRILVSLLFDQSSVMMLEQLEDNLHQGLTRKLIGLIRNNAGDSQLILSSHSPALLNKLKPQEIRFVSLHDGWTTVRPLTKRELGAAKEFLNHEGPLYDFLEPIEDE